MERIDKIKSVVAVLLLLGIVALTSCQTNIEPKEFKTGGFSILLDTGFKKIENEAAIAFFTSSKYSVICVKEDFSSLEKGSETTVSEYAEIIKNKYPEYNAEFKEQDGFCYLEYENTVEYKKFYYNSYLFKGENCFYTVHFSTSLKGDKAQIREQFLSWAETISFEEA